MATVVACVPRETRGLSGTTVTMRAVQALSVSGELLRPFGFQPKCIRSGGVVGEIINKAGQRVGTSKEWKGGLQEVSGVETAKCRPSILLRRRSGDALPTVTN